MSSAIPEDVSERLFAAISEIREYVPEVAAIAELGFPELTPEIIVGEKFLSKLFELIVSLRAHPTREDAARALREQTLSTWRATLEAAHRAGG